MHDNLGSRASRNRWIYHFYPGGVLVERGGLVWVDRDTHLDNIEAIFAAGHLTCDLMTRQGLTRIEVGDPAIKQARRERAVLAGPGGQVGNYVPFYFAPRSPMMYRIACEHRDGRPNCYPGGDRPLVYLVTTVGAVVDTGADWVASDGNAATATTEFTADLRMMEEMIDWPLLVAERWHNTPEDMDRQRRRQAEFLVHQRVPTQAITWIGVYDNSRGALLQLVDGFETPYSLELLATVHFASVQSPPTAEPAELTARVASWSLRKARMFTDKHVRIAATRLLEQDLLRANYFDLKK